MSDQPIPFTLPHWLVAPPNASRSLLALGDDFAVIENSGVAFPQYDVVPLAAKRISIEDVPEAVLVDMDGTLTSTEDLCCQGMEEMIRRMGGLDRNAWPGLNAVIDYPALIGYSAVKNFEYLSNRYGHLIDERCALRAFVEAAAWNLGPHADPEMREIIRNRCLGAGLDALLADAGFTALRSAVADGGNAPTEQVNTLIGRHGERLRRLYRCDTVQLALTIYCEHYHRRLSAPTGTPDSEAIQPNPAVGIFLALMKGLLGREAGQIAEILHDFQRPGSIRALDFTSAQSALAELGARIQAAPPRLALVTSSSRYEMNHVLRHFFHHLAREVESWPVSSATADAVRERFNKPGGFFDAIVTSSDLPQARLKPHRDPYVTALGRLGMPPDALQRAIGFEDTEPGIVSLRAAGVGLAVALPIPGTLDHDFSAAAHVITGGFAEVLLERRCFVSL